MEQRGTANKYSNFCSIFFAPLFIPAQFGLNDFPIKMRFIAAFWKRNRSFSTAYVFDDSREKESKKSTGAEQRKSLAKKKIATAVCGISNPRLTFCIGFCMHEHCSSIRFDSKNRSVCANEWCVNKGRKRQREREAVKLWIGHLSQWFNINWMLDIYKWPIDHMLYCGVTDQVQPHMNNMQIVLGCV